LSHSSPAQQRKIAILSDMSAAIGGAESIWFAAMDLYPDADLYTTVLKREILPEPYRSREIHTTFIQNLPKAKSLYKAYLPLMPLALEMLNLQEYDVLFSSHHSMIKGVIPRPDAWHICYCHSPARYLWDLFWTYSEMNGLNRWKQYAIAAVAQYLRLWDVTSSNRVDIFLANSNFTAKRIEKFYNRQAHVLFPPVNTQKFANEPAEDYYLMAGRLVAYKGFELAIDVFNENGKRLVIVGNGPEYDRLRAKAWPNVELLGRVDDETLKRLMNRCKGFIFPGKEDFGIVMAEAQSAGKPVIALGAGGALDIVVPGETGILAPEYTVSAFKRAVEEAEAISWNPNHIIQHAQQFDERKFKATLAEIIEHPEKYRTHEKIVFNQEHRSLLQPA
jgi:glycosyltransferase involved in cell wall biosynthesis